MLRNDPAVRLVDARAEAAYRTAHLPGAVNLPARDLNAPVAGVRRLVGGEVLAARLRELGIGAGPVVIYGARGGSDAAHVWWTLHAYGHASVQLLDGGIEAWQAEGHPTTAEVRDHPEPEELFEPALEDARSIGLRELAARLNDPDLVILDTRSPTEYHGVDVAAKRGGHVPGARLLPWEAALGDDWRLKPEAELRERLEAVLGAPEVVTYCQSGVRAAHTYAVLKMLGHANVRLYLESWGEWGNLDETPIAR